MNKPLLNTQEAALLDQLDITPFTISILRTRLLKAGSLDVSSFNLGAETVSSLLELNRLATEGKQDVVKVFNDLTTQCLDLNSKERAAYHSY